MPEVIYDGPFPEVSIDLDSGRRIIAERGKSPVDASTGEPVKLPKEVTDSLLEQSTWRDANKKVTPKAAQVAAEEGVDLDAVEGSGKDGAVTVSDVAEATKEDE